MNLIYAIIVAVLSVFGCFVVLRPGNGLEEFFEDDWNIKSKFFRFVFTAFKTVIAICFIPCLFIWLYPIWNALNKITYECYIACAASFAFFLCIALRISKDKYWKESVLNKENLARANSEIDRLNLILKESKSNHFN
jgi:hypothetical protein